MNTSQNKWIINLASAFRVEAGRIKNFGSEVQLNKVEGFKRKQNIIDNRPKLIDVLKIQNQHQWIVKELNGRVKKGKVKRINYQKALSQDNWAQIWKIKILGEVLLIKLKMGVVFWREKIAVKEDQSTLKIAKRNKPSIQQH